MLQKITSKDGTHIAFYRSGFGPPLLLVHGSTADHQRWSPIAPRFEKHFTIYAMDRRGRGGSGDSPDYHLLREAEDVAAVVESLGAPVSVLAHSFGALCSLEAVLLTDKISRLILYEPPLPVGLPLYAPDFPDRMQALLDSGDLDAALEFFLRQEVKMPDQDLEVYRQLPMWQERVKIVPTVLREIVIDRNYAFEAARFAALQVPVLLLLGGDSPLIFRQATEVLDAALANSHMVVMPGQQHIAMDTNPDMFMEEVLRFLLA